MTMVTGIAGMGKGVGWGRLGWQKVVATVYRKWYGRVIGGAAKGAQRITPGCRLRSLRSLRPNLASVPSLADSPGSAGWTGSGAVVEAVGGAGQIR